MDERSSRRAFLTAAATAGVTATAGCSEVRSMVGGSLDETPTVEFRRDRRRTGYVPEKTVPDAVTKEWRIPGINVGRHTAAKSSPVPDGNGNVVVAGDTGEIHSLTPDGQIDWMATTAPSPYGIHATPTIANDTVYVGAYDGALYAFDKHDGSRKWRTKLGDAIGGSPAYHDGTLYTPVEYTDPGGALFAVDAANGEVVFEDRRVGHQPHSTPGIDAETGTISIGANDGYLYTWEWPDLEFAWRFDAGGAVKSPIAVHDGAAFFGSWDDAFFRVDLASGEADWRFDAAGRVMCAPGVDTDQGVVYVGSHAGVVSALDAATGERLWEFETDDTVIGSAVVTESAVLVGDYDGNLYALDRGDGAERWSIENFGHVTCEPMVDGDVIYYTERATRFRSGGLYRLIPEE